MKKLQPLGDYVLVKKDEVEKKTASGIYLSENTKPPANVEATVIATGNGRLDKDGNLVKLNVKEGDRILIPSIGGAKVQLDDKEFTVLHEASIIGIILDVENES